MVAAVEAVPPVRESMPSKSHSLSQAARKRRDRASADNLHGDVHGSGSKHVDPCIGGGNEHSSDETGHDNIYGKNSSKATIIKRTKRKSF